MSNTDIFVVDTIVKPQAQSNADAFKLQANNEVSRVLGDVYRAVESFWFQNKYEDGTPSAEAQGNNPKPTGPEHLEALGTEAFPLLEEARYRAEYVIASLTRRGKLAALDTAKLAVPYETEFNEDGSLKTATLASWYITTVKEVQENVEAE